MTFGGLYREVSLRLVPSTYIDNIFAQPKDVLSGKPSLAVNCFITGEDHGAGATSLQVELRDGDKVIGRGTSPIERVAAPGQDSKIDPYTDAAVYATTESLKDAARHTVTITNLNGIQLWDLNTPKLYTVNVKLLRGSNVIDEDSRRIGFREAV